MSELHSTAPSALRESSCKFLLEVGSEILRFLEPRASQNMETFLAYYDVRVISNAELAVCH